MAQYATASELASYLQQDVDTSTANLLLTLASSEFNKEADTVFGGTQQLTHLESGNGSRAIVPPFKPIVSIDAVRIAGVTITDYTPIKSRIGYWTLYRSSGFGWWISLASFVGFPPQQIEVDLTYGYATVPDDVKAAVLESAATAYQMPVGAVTGEGIDDYKVTYLHGAGGIQLTPAALLVAGKYRGYPFMA